MKQKRTGSIERRKLAFRTAPISIFIGILILLSAGISVASACETYVLVNLGESIQDAIDSICPEGGVVELAPGTWNITDTIVINKSNIVLRGAGMEGEEQSLIHLLTRGSIAIKTENVSNITIENLHITGEGGWANAGAGIYMYDTSYSIIQNVWAQAMGYDQIAIGSTVVVPSKATYNVIRNCKCDGGSVPNECWHGISLRNAYYNKVENNIIHDTKYTGIQFNINCWHNEILNNTIYHAAWGGRGSITLHGACHWNIIENNHIYDGWTAIWVDGCRNNIIKNNIVHDNAYDGIGLYNGITQTNNTIINNLLYNNGWCGIYVHALNDTEIISNTIYGSGYSGICIKITPGWEEYPCENIFIRNNIIVNSSEYGINNDAGTETVYISYNNLYNNALGNYNGVSAGEGDISVDPLFADPDNEDFHLKSQAGRWNGSAWVNDSETSPCIDAGDPSEKDPDGTRINMGAYGGTSEASKSPSAATGTLTGIVTDKDTGLPIEGAVIKADSYSAITNSSGDYTISSLPVGNYTVSAEKDGYFSSSATATIIENQTTTLNFQLIKDNLPPVISNINITSITTNSATISWDTDEPATSLVKYGTTSGSYPYTKEDTSYTTSHSISLTDLSASTTYYFVVNSTDKANNSAQSSEYSFKTKEPDTIPPVISNITVSAITGSAATITWKTDEPATSQIEYGLTTSYGSSTPLDTSLVTEHTQTITSLESNTTYHFRVKSKDASNNEAVSEDNTFTTTEEKNLVAYYKFDEGEGTTAYDSSGNGNDGTIHGASWVDGKFGKALNFDGSNDYVSIPHSTSLSSDNQTIILWFKPATSPSYNDDKGLIWKAPDTGYNTEFDISLSTSGTIYGGICDGSLNCVLISSTTTVSADKWYHVALIKEYGESGDILRLFVNGVQEANTTVSWHGVQNTNEVVLGKVSSASRSTRYFNGTIDEVKIYNRALSAEEILADFQGKVSGTLTGTVTDKDTGLPIVGATVTANSHQTTTNSTGEYTITLPAGNYTLTASKTGYQSATSSATVNEGATTTVNFTLTPIPADTTPPLVTNPNATPSLIPDDTDNNPSWGETAQLNVTVTDDSEILSVTINLSQIGGSPVQPMTNIGGNVWSVTTNASAGTAGWNGTAYVPYHLQVNATDIYGNSNTSASIELIVMKNGDIDSNGVVNLNDGNHLIAYTIGGIAKYEIPEDMIVLADVDGNGEVNLNDGIYLTAYTIGEIPGYDSLH